jgi:hypothetical protein
MSLAIKTRTCASCLTHSPEPHSAAAVQMLPRDKKRRSREAKAALVALASALRLGTAAASDFSVLVVCRSMRKCIVNAHAALKQAYGGDRDGMARAEADLEVRGLSGCALQAHRIVVCGCDLGRPCVSRVRSSCGSSIVS